VGYYSLSSVQPSCVWLALSLYKCPQLAAAQWLAPALGWLAPATSGLNGCGWPANAATVTEAIQKLCQLPG